MKESAVTCVLSMGVVLYSISNVTQAQQFPITQQQRATAQQVAQQGVPLAALSPQAPDSYTVKRGDTLWRISGLFLRQPWRWPELWGMNIQAIANPHLIYPGQVLYLEKSNGYGRLSTTRPGDASTVKLSPKVRSQDPSSAALPTLPMDIIAAFLSEPLVIDSNTLAHSPRIIASSDQRSMLSQGDHAYARGSAEIPLVQKSGRNNRYRLFRQATPLHDPITKELLGYEAQYIGEAELKKSETAAPATTPGNESAQPATLPLPATVFITKTKEEIRPGDRLVSEPPAPQTSFIPYAPKTPLSAHVVSLYGGTHMRYGGQHQLIAINKGLKDGVTPGMVLSVMSKGRSILDKTDTQPTNVQLPEEDNGLAMVFKSFDRVAYALILDVQRSIEVGDRLSNPH